MIPRGFADEFWSISKTPALFIQTKIKSIVLHTGDSCNYLLTAPVNVIILRWIWKSGKDERLIYLFPDVRKIFLNTIDDIQWLSAFEPLLYHYDPGNNRIKVRLSLFGIIPKGHDSNIISLHEMRSNGGYSFHFGHFIIETIPYLELAYAIGCGLSTYTSVSQWMNDLIVMIGRPCLQNVFCPLDVNKFSSIRLNGIFIEATQSRIMFAKMSKHQTNKIIESLVPSTGYFSLKHASLKIYIISRKNDIPTATGAIRWLNEHDLLEYHSEYDFQLIQPEKFGFLRLFQRIQSEKPALVISANGSAVYQFFLYNEYRPKVLMLLGSVNISQLWHGQMANFKAFSSQLWLLFISSHQPSDWNSPFEYPAEVILEAITHILSGSTLSLRISANYYLLSPSKKSQPFDKVS